MRRDGPDVAPVAVEVQRPRGGRSAPGVEELLGSRQRQSLGDQLGFSDDYRHSGQFVGVALLPGRERFPTPAAGGLLPASIPAITAASAEATSQ